MKKSLVLLLTAAVWGGLFVGNGEALVTFQEDWDTGAINPGKWTVEGGSSGPFVYDLGVTGQSSSGDYALFIAGPFDYTTGIRSASSFNRASQLRCSFKLLRDSAPFSWAGVGGPWSGVSAMPGVQYPSLTQIEAGLNRHNPNNNQSYYREGLQTTFAGDGAALSSAFNTAFDNATTKANAIIVRVTLGEATGAKMEWSVGGGGFTTEFDTIGQTGGQDLGGGNKVSASDPVWLVFAGAGEGSSHARAIVDDIVVEALSADVAIDESDGSTQVNENGPTTDTYTLVIVGDPNQDVVVTADPDDQLEVNGNGAGSSIALTFTPADANTPQTITVIAVDDLISEGLHTGTITHSSSSGDPNYHNLSLASVVVEITDNDLKAVMVTESADCTNVYESGAWDTYTIVLAGLPTGGDAVITVDPDNQFEVNGAGQDTAVQLTFTTLDWDTARTVTVSAFDDALSEGPHTGTVVHTAAGGGYDSVGVQDVVANITDNEHYCGEQGQVWLVADIAGPGGVGDSHRDCYVNLYDFGSVAAEWLQCTDRFFEQCIQW